MICFSLRVKVLHLGLRAHAGSSSANFYLLLLDVSWQDGEACLLFCPPGPSAPSKVAVLRAQASSYQTRNTAHQNQDKRGGRITEPQKQPATQHPNTGTYSLGVCLAVLLLMGFQQFLGKHRRKLRKCYCVLRAAGARAAPWTQERGLQDTASPAPYVQQQHLCNPLKRQPRFFFIFYFLKLTRISYFCCCHSHKLGINPMQSEPDVL